MTPNEARELWVQALESGAYDRGTGQLAYDHNGQRQFCCLGVACEVAIKHGVIARYDDGDETLDHYDLVREWLGLADSEGCYDGGDRSLISDNDSGYTFREIAATIRAEPEGLVVS
jgi:hypothetical protein